MGEHEMRNKSIGRKSAISIALLGCLLATTAHAQTGKIIPTTPLSTPKITSITLADSQIETSQHLSVSVAGEGRACNYYLTIVNTDTQQTWELPQVAAFPAPDSVKIDTSQSQYAHGNYKLTAKARDNDVRSGVKCQGGGNFVAFKKVRPSLSLSGMPQVVDVQITAGKKMGGTTRFRTDELIKFNVVGSVENNEAKDAANRCGWTAQLIDNNGVAKTIGKDTRFGVWQTGTPLTGFATGDYTLTARYTSENAGATTNPCLGKATKKVEIFRAPGIVKNVSLEIYADTDGFTDRAYVRITPKIDGPTCQYKIHRSVNHGKNVIVTNHWHKEGIVDVAVPAADVYPDDETYLDITVLGIADNYFEGGSCDGSVSKSVTVYDDKSKKPVYH
jgi:hypothetical protein